MKIKKLLIFVIAILIIYPSIAFSAGAILNDQHNFYNGHDPSNTSLYVYDSSDATSDTAGRYYCLNYTLKTIQVSVPTLGSTSISMRIEGQTDSSGDVAGWANIYTKSYTGATTIDDIVMITEHLKYIRVGLKVTSDGSDDLTITGNFGIPKSLR